MASCSGTRVMPCHLSNFNDTSIITDLRFNSLPLYRIWCVCIRGLPSLCFCPRLCVFAIELLFFLGKQIHIWDRQTQCGSKCFQKNAWVEFSWHSGLQVDLAGRFWYQLASLLPFFFFFANLAVSRLCKGSSVQWFFHFEVGQLDWISDCCYRLYLLLILDDCSEILGSSRLLPLLPVKGVYVSMWFRKHGEARNRGALVARCVHLCVKKKTIRSW